MLLLDSQPGFAQFEGQSVLINIFREPGPEHIEDGKRAADDLSRQIVQPIFICVHSRHRLSYPR